MVCICSKMYKKSCQNQSFLQQRGEDWKKSMDCTEPIRAQQSWVGFQSKWKFLFRNAIWIAWRFCWVMKIGLDFLLGFALDWIGYGLDTIMTSPNFFQNTGFISLNFWFYPNLACMFTDVKSFRECQILCVQCPNTHC